MMKYSGFVIRPLYIWLFYAFYELLNVGPFVLFAIIGPKSMPTNPDEWAWLMLEVYLGIASLMPLWDVLWGIGGYLDKRFVIDADGVLYYTKRKRFYLRWAEIQHVVLYPDRIGRFKKHCFVCFIATMGLPARLCDWHDYKETAFGIQYRPELVEIIEQLGGKKVELIDQISKN